MPAPPEPDHTPVQHDWPARDRPGHARTLQPLGKNNLAGGLGDARAPRQGLAALVPIAHPLGALLQVGVGLLIVRGLPPSPLLTPQGRRRL